ncbi:MAG: vWA domain-containing protein [Nanobdellota archaeon]
MRKAIFYSIDAAVALLLLLGSVFIFLNIDADNVSTDNLQRTGNDLLVAMDSMKVSEAEYETIKKMIDNGTITERQMDKSILETLAEMWSSNQTEEAAMIIDEITNNTEKDVDFRLMDESLYKKEENRNLSRVHTRQVITGITKNKTVKGVSSRAYLTNISNKLTSETMTFGGYVGQGNITKHGLLLPPDADIEEFYIEGFFASNLTMSINGEECMNITGEDTGLESKRYNLIDCNGSLEENNTVDLGFKKGIEKSYIGGGLIEVKYKTENIGKIEDKLYLPGINGIINLYSSIPVKGIDSMDMYLHYNINRTIANYSDFIVRLGNRTIMEDNSTNGENSEMIKDINPEGTTLPLRVGFDDLTYEIDKDGSADVILITDISGSMDRCVDSNDDCGDGCPGSECRIDLAKELGKSFSEKVINVTGNRVGLATYSTDGHNEHDLSKDEASINSSIDSFSTGGGTCISCAIRQARIMLQEQSNESRNKFIIVMTDGIANLETYDDINNTNSCPYSWCGGWGCGCPDYKSDCGGCMTHSSECDDYVSENAIDDAINDSCYAKSEINSTLHSIGFGAGAISCDYATNTLQDIADCGEGQYFSSTNVSGLYDIYDFIAGEIVESSTETQTMKINKTNTELYPDSYIRFNTTTEEEGITVTKVTDHLGSCTPDFESPEAEISEAMITSFSSDYWTDLIGINGETVFNLSSYSDQYSKLGDPFILDIPPEKFNNDNSLLIRTGSSPDNSTGCSPDSRLIYKVRIPTSIPQTDVLDKAEGCEWTIEYENNDSSTIKVPEDYSGTDDCYFTSSNIEFKEDDSIDNAVHEFLQELDINGNDKVDIRLDKNEFNIETSEVNEIPSLLGPSVAEVVIS